MSVLQSLPQVEASQQALHNRLLRRRQAWQGQVNGSRLELVLSHQALQTPAAFSVPARLGSAALQLDLDAALLAHLLGPLSLLREFHGLPPLLQGVLLEQALLPWLEPLEQAFAAPLSLDAATAPCSYRLTLHISQSGERLGELGMALSAEAAEKVVELLERHVLPDRHPLPALQLKLSLQRGWQSVSLAELRSLQPGDVLMLECPSGGDGLLVLADGHRQARYQRQDDELRLLDAFQLINPTTEYPMGQDVDDAQLDDVPLTVICQVGSLELSLGQLRELGEGSVLSLSAADAERVELMVNGRCVGRGELVAIGDGLGVRLTRFASL